VRKGKLLSQEGSCVTPFKIAWWVARLAFWIALFFFVIPYGTWMGVRATGRQYQQWREKRAADNFEDFQRRFHPSTVQSLVSQYNPCAEFGGNEVPPNVKGLVNDPKYLSLLPAQQRAVLSKVTGDKESQAIVAAR
jgi:hypothetical protein